MRDAGIHRQQLYIYSNVNFVIKTILLSPMAPFTVQGLRCWLEFAIKMLFLTSWLETHVTCQHR